MMLGQEETGDIKTRCSDKSRLQRNQVFNFVLSADGARNLKRSPVERCLHANVFSTYSFNVQCASTIDFFI